MMGVKVTGHLSPRGGHLAISRMQLCGHLVALNISDVLLHFMCMYFFSVFHHS